ncbi:alpha/beta fold hydrolase [Demequina activiva]|uniref:Epoxide hydrolase n=1 Tax=Demequina activiva TaxID=1582364 RepID=A0A919Q4W8_9MICO|nr:alpha/beta hydrolase [Demequina activiva]GIG53900.1 epoxide hydrolase [Demequina activiva]
MTNQSEFSQPSRIAVNGVELEVFEAGRENAGNPMVLCHGWPDHALTWRRQVPALVEAGYHVIAPNQRGFGGSSRPTEVEAYDVEHLTGDLAALLDHFGYESAAFVGHDWGATVSWWLTALRPERVSRVIALSVPYLARGDMPWVPFLEAILGADYYMVHFNRQPGVADAVLDQHTRQFLRNLYRMNLPAPTPAPGNAMINLALAQEALGDPILSDGELDELVAAFEESGFAPGINWYRNLDRNWELLGEVDPVIHQPALMIYGDRDPVARAEGLQELVPNVEEVSLDCGHWIQQERPEETTQLIVDWLARGR